MAETYPPCNTNRDATGRSGLATNVNTSKFVFNYACLEPGETVPTVTDFPLDDDQSLPHLIPEVSDVSAFDYLALKSSILAIEKAIAGESGIDLGELVNQMNGTPYGWTSLAGSLVHFNTDMFVPLSGCIDINSVSHPMTGPLIMSSTQKTAWGQYCETYAVFAGVDSTISVNLPVVGTPVMPFRSDAIGTPPTIPLAIVGHDATPNVPGTRHRRVRLFDDLDVVEDIRFGRDIEGPNAFFDVVYIGGSSLEDSFVSKAGDSMTGSLYMSFGSSVIVNHVNGKMSLSTTSNSSSPTLEFADSNGIWGLNSRVGNLYVAKNSSTDSNIMIVNSGSGKANVAVDGSFYGVTSGGQLSSSAIDLSENGKAWIRSTPSSTSFYGPTASNSHYVLSSAEAGNHFDGSEDLISHLDNVNAHHEEVHSLGSHVVYDSVTGSYRAIALPSDISLSFGEMVEGLINHGNADAYHTHAGSSVRWGNLWFSDSDHRTIIDYMESNYCRQPCSGGSGSGDWDLLPRVAGSDPTRIQEFVLGKSVSATSGRIVGSSGFMPTTGSIYGYRPYWSLLELSSSDSTGLTSYISGTVGHKKGTIDTSANGYGYMPFWGALKQVDGGLTIEQWLNANICSIISAQGCGGTGGTIRWGSLGKSTSEPTVTVEQTILGTANGGTAVGAFFDGTHYGYLPYWSNLKRSSVSTTSITDYIASVDSATRAWATSTFCPQSGGCGSGTGYWGALGKSVSEPSVTISSYITGISPSIVGEMGASPTYGYKPYWSLLKRSSSDSMTIEAWIAANICSILASSNVSNCGLGGGGISSGSNVGSGQYAPFISVQGTAMQFQTLTAGNNISISGNVISATSTSTSVTGQNSGTGQYEPFASAANNVLTFNRLNAGTGISISGNTISASSSAGVTVNNVGTGIYVYGGTTGSPVSSMSFKSIAPVAGSGITVTESSGTIQIGTSSGSVLSKGATFVFSGYHEYGSVYNEETRDLKDSSGNIITASNLMVSMGIPSGYSVSDFKWYISGGVSYVVPDNPSAKTKTFKGRVVNNGSASSPTFKAILRLDFIDGTTGTVGVNWMVTATKI